MEHLPTLEQIAMREAEHFPVGNFSFFTDKFAATMFRELYAAVNAADAWDWLRDADPEGGFMFGSAPELTRISEALTDSVGHSAASFAMTLRALQRMTRIGWTPFVAEYIVRQEEQALKQKKD